MKTTLLDPEPLSPKVPYKHLTKQYRVFGFKTPEETLRKKKANSRTALVVATRFRPRPCNSAAQAEHHMPFTVFLGAQGSRAWGFNPHPKPLNPRGSVKGLYKDSY